MKKRNTKWNYMGFITLLTALATCAIALSNWRQLGVMEGTLGALRESTRLSQAPLLRVVLGPNVDAKPIVSYLPTEEGGERWALWYWVINVSDHPAHELRYYHETTTNEEINPPTRDEYEGRRSKQITWPGDVLECGYDSKLRQQAVDELKEGHKLFRHFYVQYEDQYGNSYTYKAKWRIEDYETGKPLGFYLLEYTKVVK